jgi:NADPH2:quinone reductase
VVHAAAGGVGLLLTQWAKNEGKTVIATVGNDEKAALAREHGAHHVILYRNEDVAKRVRELTRGEGADVVYDAVGKDTFAASLDSLRVRGLLVSFGQASGPVPALDPLVLNAKGSLFLTRPKLGDYVRTPEELTARAAAVFDAISKGILRVRIAQTYPLADAARAHVDLEARKTTGSTLLLP